MGKNASFFINTIPLDSNKNDGLDTVKRVHKSPKSPKIIEKLESFADHNLGNIQNVTPRDCSYGGELARLGGPARLGEMIFVPRSYGIFYLSSIKKFVMPPEKDCLIK